MGYQRRWYTIWRVRPEDGSKWKEDPKYFTGDWNRPDFLYMHLYQGYQKSGDCEWFPTSDLEYGFKEKQRVLITNHESLRGQSGVIENAVEGGTELSKTERVWKYDVRLDNADKKEIRLYASQLSTWPSVVEVAKKTWTATNKVRTKFTEEITSTPNEQHMSNQERKIEKMKNHLAG